MPTAQNVVTLYQQTTSPLINEMQSVYLTYKKNVPNYELSQEEIVNLQAQLLELNRQTEELERVEQTYDREFLDRVNAPPPTKGFLQKYGLVTTQDWVMSMFLLAFITFSMSLILLFVVHSQAKLKAFLIALSIIIISGAFTGLLIFKYV